MAARTLAAVGLLRRTTEPGPAVEVAPAPAQPPVGKGRPTPKRREAERTRRAAVPAPATRREAYRRRRSEIKGERRTMRRALATGDEKNLPPRDAGPVRRHVRDVVDSRRNVGGLVLMVVVVALALGRIRSATGQSVVFLGELAVVVLLVVDMVFLVRRVKREVRSRFGDGEVRGVAPYAVMRAMQFRRLRMPPPRVKRGADLP
ncbi:MAG TPA: DUF3043 domain-containing protein [Mycobacteriales bacterium]|nr:DUF3043 domain-containing protein [Mycobacteriales bacterium]